MRRVASAGYETLTAGECQEVVDFIESHGDDRAISLRLLEPSFRKVIYTRSEGLDWRPLVMSQLCTLGAQGGHVPPPRRQGKRATAVPSGNREAPRLRQRPASILEQSHGQESGLVLPTPRSPSLPLTPPRRSCKSRLGSVGSVIVSVVRHSCYVYEDDDDPVFRPTSGASSWSALGWFGAESRLLHHVRMILNLQDDRPVKRRMRREGHIFGSDHGRYPGSRNFEGGPEPVRPPRRLHP